MTQAERDLTQARVSLREELYEWVCFAAHQAAEKAVKGLFYALNATIRGHSIALILKKLPDGLQPPEGVEIAASRLDKYYTVSRYPNGFDGGAPGEHFLKVEAEEAIEFAERIVEFCRSNIPR